MAKWIYPETNEGVPLPDAIKIPAPWDDVVNITTTIEWSGLSDRLRGDIERMFSRGFSVHSWSSKGNRIYRWWAEVNKWPIVTGSYSSGLYIQQQYMPKDRQLVITDEHRKQARLKAKLISDIGDCTIKNIEDIPTYGVSSYINSLQLTGLSKPEMIKVATATFKQIYAEAGYDPASDFYAPWAQPETK